MNRIGHRSVVMARVRLRKIITMPSFVLTVHESLHRTHAGKAILAREQMIEDRIDSRAKVVQNAADEVEDRDGTPLSQRQLRSIESTGD